jgi:Kef-type K+ transport system membrane component KefB
LRSVPAGNDPPRLILAWESLAGPAQILIAFPVLVVVFFLIHLGPFGLSATRSLFYGVFWAIPATAAVVIATKTEAAKRRHGGGRDGDD